jgi:anti-anti-sigma regulatory factor
LILDFSSIRRLDGRALDTLEKASAKADERGVRLVVRAASVEVYLVLKLVKLAPRFAFQN